MSRKLNKNKINSKGKPVANATEAIEDSLKTGLALDHSHKFRSACPINQTLEWLGDSWSLLIIRDLMMKNHTSYQALLYSGEKIATNTLASKLKLLELHGFISKKSDPDDARKYIYALTERGAYLAPLIVEMALYGSKFGQNPVFSTEVLQEVQRNKSQFIQKLIRSNLPKEARKKPLATRVTPELDDTLSLLDLL